MTDDHELDLLAQEDAHDRRMAARWALDPRDPDYPDPEPEEDDE